METCGGAMEAWSEEVCGCCGAWDGCCGGCGAWGASCRGQLLVALLAVPQALVHGVEAGQSRGGGVRREQRVCGQCRVVQRRLAGVVVVVVVVVRL